MCVSQQEELKNTTKNVGKIHVKNALQKYKKLRENTFFLPFPPSTVLILIAFLAVSLHEELGAQKHSSSLVFVLDRLFSGVFQQATRRGGGGKSGLTKNNAVCGQGDIMRFLCFFCAVCFPVFWRRQPEQRKSKSLWRVRFPPRGFRLDCPAASAGEQIPGVAGALEFGAGLLIYSSWGLKKKKKLKLPTQTPVK
jgi:hypothetical protein